MLGFGATERPRSVTSLPQPSHPLPLVPRPSAKQNPQQQPLALDQRCMSSSLLSLQRSSSNRPVQDCVDKLGASFVKRHSSNARATSDGIPALKHSSSINSMQQERCSGQTRRELSPALRPDVPHSAAGPAAAAALPSWAMSNQVQLSHALFVVLHGAGFEESLRTGCAHTFCN